MLRFLHQLPRAFRQQWNLSVRTSQAVQSEDEGLDRARVYAALEKPLTGGEDQDAVHVVNTKLVKHDEQLGRNGKNQVQKRSLHDYYQHAYNQVPYTCREALGWGSALVVGLQILHLWKSGWFGKRSRHDVEKLRDRECLVKSFYRLAMAMPQSSGISRYVIKPGGKDIHKTENLHSKNSSEDSIKAEDEVPSLEEAVDSWKRFSDAYVALKLTQEGVELAKEGSFAKAIRSWERASKAGLDKAHYNLALCYENGHGVERNLHKALEHYEAAANKGHSGSLFNLAMLHMSGEDPVPQDKDLAVHLLQQAATKGLPQAQRELGVLFTEEEMKDMKRACELFEEAASQEDVVALYYLGICYEQGWGTEQNECKAAELYTKASRSGHEGALYNLATFFEDGKGGLPEDKEAALELFQQSLKNGNPAAKEEICRLNSLMLNRKLGDEMDASGDKALRQSLSQPSFTENARHNLSSYFDVDVRGSPEHAFSGSKVVPIVSVTEEKPFTPVQFYIGDGKDEGVCMEHDKSIHSTLEGGPTYEQLRLALANQGHIDLDVIDTCRRSSSLNDLIYHVPGDLSLQQSSQNGPISSHVRHLSVQVSGLVPCS